MSKTGKVNEWKFTLEKTTGGGSSSKDSLKEPFGYKQDITDVNIRIGQKNGISHKEMLEGVRSSIFQRTESSYKHSLVFQS